MLQNFDKLNIYLELEKNDAMNLNFDFSTHPIYLDIKSKVIVCKSSNIKILLAEMNIFEILTN